MSDKAERSPSPSEVGFAISRRNFMIGAAALGGAALLGACGDDDDDNAVRRRRRHPPVRPRAAATEAPATTAAEAGGEVTFGSNYSDEKPKAGMAAALATTGVNIKINTTDHNTYQQNFNTYIQQPDDVDLVVRRLPHAGLRRQGRRRRHLRRVVQHHRDERGLQERLLGARRQAVLRALLLLPMGRALPEELVRGQGIHSPGDVGRIQGAAQTDAGPTGSSPLAGANDGKWPQMGMFDMLNLRINGYDFHVSLMGGKESWTDAKVKSRLLDMDGDPALLPGGRERAHLAGRRQRHRRQDDRHVPARHVHHLQLRLAQPSRTSSTTSTSSCSPSSTTSSAKIRSRLRSTAS